MCQDCQSACQPVSSEEKWGEEMAFWKFFWQVTLALFETLVYSTCMLFLLRQLLKNNSVKLEIIYSKPLFSRTPIISAPLFSKLLSLFELDTFVLKQHLILHVKDYWHLKWKGLSSIKEAQRQHLLMAKECWKKGERCIHMRRYLKHHEAHNLW